MSNEYYAGRADLAEFDLKNLRKVMNDERAHTEEIERAIRPLTTIERGIQIIRIAGSNPLKKPPRAERKTPAREI